MIATTAAALTATATRGGVRRGGNPLSPLRTALAWLVVTGCGGQAQSTPDNKPAEDLQTLRGGAAGAHAQSVAPVDSVSHVTRGVTSLPPATPAQLRELERMLAPQLARPQAVDVEVLDDGTHVMHPGEGYYHVTAAVVREGGRFEVMCLEQPSIPDHRHPIKELK